MKIENYIIGYDKYNESDGPSIGVKEVLRIKDLMYSFYINDKLQHQKILTKTESIDKFGSQMSKETIDKILRYD
jgi:hypothetical protein